MNNCFFWNQKEKVNNPPDIQVPVEAKVEVEPDCIYEIVDKTYILDNNIYKGTIEYQLTLDKVVFHNKNYIKYSTRTIDDDITTIRLCLVDDFIDVLKETIGFSFIVSSRTKYIRINKVFEPIKQFEIESYSFNPRLY